MLRSKLQLMVLAAWVAVGTARASAAPVAISHDATGLTVKAEGARVEDVLDALASREGFAVIMQRGVERPPVDVDVRAASLDDVLRRVLSQRNYAIAYRAGDAALEVSRVELLLPRAPRGAPGAPGPIRPIRPTIRRH